MGALSESSPAAFNLTDVRLLACMGSAMVDEMWALGESSPAAFNLADVRLFARVGEVVYGEIAFPSERLAASRPVTGVPARRPLTLHGDG